MVWLFGIHKIWLLIFILASTKKTTAAWTWTFHDIFCAPVNGLFPTTFHLRSREAYNLSNATAKQEGKIFENHLKPDKDVVVTIHEYLRGCDKPFTLRSTKAYLTARPGVQIINVCWSAGFPKLAGFPLMVYADVTKFVPCVGDVIAEFLKRIHRESHVPWNRITLIGHSLGCQLSGDVGNKVDGKLWKIIACDPATPFYGISPLTSSLLSPKSAQNVIVAHTSIGQYNMGTADFYANSVNQPGCEKHGINLIESWSCSHSRSFEYFIESILKPDAFPARKCISYKNSEKKLCEEHYSTFFGPDTRVTGIYFFETKSEKPYY